MRVTIKQRGGFVGGEVVLAQVDTATLDAATRRSIEQQVQATVSSAGQEAAIGADLMTYELEVEDGSTRSGGSWIEDGGTAAQPVKTLLDRIAQVG